jgi:hypothetical protein
VLFPHVMCVRARRMRNRGKKDRIEKSKKREGGCVWYGKEERDRRKREAEVYGKVVVADRGIRMDASGFR